MDNAQQITQIQSILQELRPLILNDGGDIQFVSFHEGIVKVKLHGACINCPMSFYTLKMGIEDRLKAAIPDVLHVVAE